MAQLTRERVLAGRYRLIRRLGSGGMAAVYLAEDERLGRRVAVKRLHADGPEEMARRFEREAKLLASLNHPKVVAVFDIVADPGGVLIVMEYVEGQTLADALMSGPLPAIEVTNVVSDVAAALDHAHRHGVVHRDVKPGNVLLASSGGAKLADLGIATAAESTQITSTGTVLGTAAYMAPEHLEGKDVTPAVDVYALAAVAFEALSGRKARPGRTPLEIARRVATEPPPDLRAAWPAAPPGAAEALKRGMARDPADRPPSAGALAEELRAGLEAVPASAAHTAPLPLAPSRPQAAPSGALPPLQRGRSRRRIGAFAPLAALAAVVVAVAAILIAGGDEQPARDDAGAALTPPQEQQPSGEQQQQQQTEQAPAEQAADPVAEGLRLHNEGFALYRQGRFADAIEPNRRAVELLQGTDRPEYWYALFNLGSSLRQAGRPAEAIPILEQRLQYSNQRGTVERELELAREAAGGGGRGSDDRPGRGKGRDKKDRDDD